MPQTKNEHGTTWLKRALRGLLTRLAIFLPLLFGGLYLLQDRLLYFPSAATLEDTLATARASGLRVWPNASDYRALLAEPATPARATLILLHGNAGTATERAWYAQTLTDLGLRVLLVEYPGYGPRAGKPGEATLVADAAATVQQAHTTFGGPILLSGESLGAAVAAGVAARVPEHIDSLLLITPFDTLANAARHHYPWLPVDFMLRDRYDSASRLAAWHRPVAVIISDQDRVLPPALGENLFAAANAPKRRWRVPSADHNDWMLHFNADAWREAVGFLLAAPRS